MKIYTSYFGNLEKIPEEIVPIAICLKLPKFYDGKVYQKIAPTAGILSRWKANEDEEEYEEDYKRWVLDKHTQEEVYKEIEGLSKGKDVVLLCYEKPHDFCHRHLFAEWMRNAGYDVREFE